MLQESENLSTQTLKKMLGKDAKYINFYKTFPDDITSYDISRIIYLLQYNISRKADGLSDNKIPTKKKKSASSFSDFSAW